MNFYGYFEEMILSYMKNIHLIDKKKMYPSQVKISFTLSDEINVDVEGLEVYIKSLAHAFDTFIEEKKRLMKFGDFKLVLFPEQRKLSLQFTKKDNQVVVKYTDYTKPQKDGGFYTTEMIMTMFEYEKQIRLRESYKPLTYDEEGKPAKVKTSELELVRELE